MGKTNVFYNLKKQSTILKGTAQSDILIGYGLSEESMYEQPGSKITDVLYAGAGDDRLYGGAGDDRLFGESGNDYLVGGSGADIIDGGKGYDTVSYFRSTAAVTVDLEKQTASGGEAQGDKLKDIEAVVGSDWDDTLTGSRGNDQIDGGSGNDRIAAGAGNDMVWGGDGNDVIDGGRGDDIIYTGAGSDRVSGGAGNDYINSSFSGLNNILNGDEGNDEIFSVGAGTQINGGSGDDNLDIRYSSNVVVNGGADNDEITIAHSTNVTVNGGAGNDRIVSESSSSTINAGDGDDEITVSGYAPGAMTPGVIVVDAGAGNDVIRGTGGSGYDFTGGAGRDVFYMGSPNLWYTGKVDIIRDFNNTVGTGDLLSLGVQASRANGAFDVVSTGADITVANDFASTGTDFNSLHHDLDAAVYNHRLVMGIDSWEQSGDTVIVKITGDSLAGTDVTYICHNDLLLADSPNGTNYDYVVALVGDSKAPIDYANFVFNPA